MIHFFILKDKHGRPSKISMGVYVAGVKVKGEKALPEKLTDDIITFKDLDEVRRARCTCNDHECNFIIYLAQAINRFNEQMKAL